MSRHERYSENLFDFRTGRPTAISSASTGESQRAACATLNRERTRGILETAQGNAPREQVSLDVWTTAFERRLTEWEIPLIPLSDLGLQYDQDGFLNSEFLKPLPSGAEAEPYLDQEHGVVYKLFNLRLSGALGRKLSLERDDEDGEFQIELKDADLRHTLTKLSILNLAGAHTTEIVGLADTGDYLIAKQPLAFPYEDFETDLKSAVQSMRGIIPRQGGFRQSVTIVWVEELPWVVGDLHKRNIMKNSQGEACVILNRAISDAKHFRRTGKEPTYDLSEGIHDDEL